MKCLATTNRQAGATLVVGLIMLVLITLMLITALNLGTANFRTVSNMQFRDEAIAAANKAIQQVVGSPFTTAPAPQSIQVDLENTSPATYDYTVNIATPVCVSATVAASSDPSSVSLPGGMSAESTWNTVWDIDATVSGANNVGAAAVEIRTGVRVLLSQSQKDAVCS